MRHWILPALALSLAVSWPSPSPGQTAQEAALDPGLLDRALTDAAKLPRLRALIVARHGKTLVERVFRGPGLDVPINVKSVSKTVISALVGAAIDHGVLEGPDQRVAALLPGKLPNPADPRLGRVTVGHLLSMRSGLERTSGRNYGRWVQSRDWVRFALARPFTEEPGGEMQYSTGNTHLLSAILTRAAGRSTLALVRTWLGAPLEITIPPWQTDPQGIYFGGNNMLLSPRALLRIGELYRNGGRHNGRRVISETWVRASWTPRAVSPYSGDDYGYGWFITAACGQAVYYARGFGGQFIYVVPSLKLTIVLTSTATTRTRVGGYRSALKSLVGNGLIAAALRADGGPESTPSADCML
jgi:CubicO group peptidase (beta-lactamase class C family)